MGALHLNALYVLKNGVKGTYYFLCLPQETGPIILIPGSNLLHDTTPEFVNMILDIAVT